MTTPSEARNDLYRLVVTAWKAQGDDVGPIDYEDVPRPKNQPIPPDDSCPWLRVQMRHTAGGQATLANDVGARRFRRVGIFTVQVFCPMGSSLRRPEELSKIVNDALEGVHTPNDVWITNVRMNEIGPDGHWYQVNVIADFQYDEVK